MYLFLFCINNSGSTAIARFIASAGNVYLPPYGHGEGQFVPSVRPVMRAAPWVEDVSLPWPMIRRRWDELLRASGKDIFLEKSPPNLMRAPDIARHFPDARFLVSLADPYSYCGSCWYRYCHHADKAGFLRRMAGEWLVKAQWQRRNLETLPQALRLSYEQFCADPSGAAALIRGLVPELGPIDPAARVTVKRDTGPIVNTNARNILLIERGHLAAVGEVLATRPDLLEYFGYGVLSDAAFQALGASRAADEAAARLDAHRARLTSPAGRRGGATLPPVRVCGEGGGGPPPVP